MEQVYELYIKTTPELLWHAILDPDIRAKYNFGVRVTSTWSVGAPIDVRTPDGSFLLGTGEVLEVDPPHLLVHTQVARWSPEVEAEGASRVTWDIEAIGDSCRLILTHDQLRDGADREVYGGWPMVLSGLKTWLETGGLLTTPGSVMYP
jgi:uncharacterized protein YndB with AHSA1/START domain